MSRGGRGGGWGGGAGGPNAAGKMGGQALPWEYDPDLDSKLSSKPSERFPPIQPPIAEPPSADERRMVHHYRTLRARIHDGPFYTILDSTARVNKSGNRSPQAAHYNPFDSAPTYSQRFVRKRNTLPRLSTRPFVKEFFPLELHSTIDPSTSSTTTSNQKKSLTLFTRTKADRVAAALASMNAADDADNPDALGDDDENDDNDDAPKDGDDAAEEEDPDQFDEEDEDEMDDYNAEQYFDGGDDDDFGGDEGGGDGDGDF